MIKLGFIMNLTFLLCIVITQLLIWLLDGTLFRVFVQLLNIRKIQDGIDSDSRVSKQMQFLRSIEEHLTMNFQHTSTKD